jgi:hypothetical protein
MLSRIDECLIFLELNVRGITCCASDAGLQSLIFFEFPLEIL